MAYRVVQWATGLLGCEAVRGVLAHPELELVGAWVHSPDKVGRDVGEIAGVGPIGVTATGSIDEICALDADAVVYAPVLASTSDVIRLLESGKNVVTPVGWIHPGESAGVAAVQAACLRGGVTLHGTGINPGGITERFPLMCSALCRDVRHVRAEEFSDIRNYPTDYVVREVMLFGKPPDVAARSPMLEVLGHGFMQSIDMVASELGFALDPEKRSLHEMAVATQPIDSPVGTIEAGTVAAQRFTWQGTVRGEPVITVRVNWLMGEAHLEPAWRLGEQRFEVELDADPPVSVTFHGLHPPVVGERPEIGLTAPAMHCVNAIPYVVRAEPGIRTYLDLPLLAGRAARHLGVTAAGTER
ncbi:MAG: dihydrodipicolinate reductase [Acidimicrobiia bacterium]|nr:MAG: dihydrodipicolinate reductase [Acidimicrobiia bacterium]